MTRSLSELIAGDVAPGSLSIRPASQGDEAFILSLERSHSSSFISDRWGRPAIERPGLGDAFPHAYFIIQNAGQDIGCIALFEEHDVLQIEQLYVKVSETKEQVVTEVLNHLLLKSANAFQRVCVIDDKDSPSLRAFEKAGFKAVSAESHKALLERKITIEDGVSRYV
ncbi:hypothetical protein [Agrobacterium sp. NPDC090273]|uniref:hypothetical protein n=1 Tax=Agrobacterium sp. NPDC090273 TaxID=3363919 RepID=UPI00383BAC23